SIATQLFGTWTCERIVARRSFYPVPNVTSALVSLTPSRDVRAKQTAADPAFQRFVVRLFQYRRKSLKNALTHATSLPADRIERLASMGTSEGESAPCRAETLSPDLMKELFENVADMAPAFVSTLRIQ
ncbi:MAG: rRNA adenine N-6-methyltransferase family protein, partial [Saccharofermentanales bacterium]